MGNFSPCLGQNFKREREVEAYELIVKQFFFFFFEEFESPAKTFKIIHQYILSSLITNEALESFNNFMKKNKLHIQSSLIRKLMIVLVYFRVWQN